MSPSIEIDNDFSRIFAFLEKHGNEFVPVLASLVDTKAYAAKLSEKAKNYFLFEGAADIGHAAVYFGAPKNDQTAFVSSFCIWSRYSSNGYGTQLLNWVISECRQSGAKKLTLETGMENYNAIRFYERNGFQIFETRKAVHRLYLSLE